MLSFFKRTIMAGTVLLAPTHAGIVVVYSLARLAGHSDHWLIDALSYVLPVLLLLSVLHFPGAVWRRSTFLLCSAGLPLLVFGILYAPRYVPRLGAEEAGPSFAAMSYNLWGGNQEYDRILEAIDEYSPDVVGLQELSIPIQAEILDELTHRYPYWAIDDDQGMFSRYPIVSHAVLEIGDERAPITVQHLNIEIQGKRLGLVNAHPHSPQLMASRLLGLRLGYPSGLANRWRDLEVRALIEAIESMEGPLVVLGDFNLTDLQVVYGEMTDTLLDVHREVGFGLGLTRTPVRGIGPATWRIDYVFHTPDLIALRTDLGAFGGSDHRPVVAKLAFEE